MHGRVDALLTAAELAERPVFRLGAATIEPATRTVTGPGGSAQVEPRVMQVLVVLADAGGAVVTRDTLLARCWGGVYFGDDSLNRAVSGVRRVASGVADGSFAIETVPRTGYRLTTGPAPLQSEITNSDAGAAVETTAPDSSRRWFIAGGVAATAAAALGAWSVLRRRTDPRAVELVERARRALRDELPDRDAQGVGLLRQAVALAPDHAEAWGLLALALRNVAELAPPAETTAATHACETAAKRALALDPSDGNALTAMATLHHYYGDWVAGEDRLRSVLAAAPDNTAALGHLTTLLQSAGRARESWASNEHASKVDPLSPTPQFRRAMKYWIFGRVEQADLAIERALQLWPRHPGVWHKRLLLFAFTGRAQAALALLDDQEARPPELKEPAISLWRTSLVALETRAPASIDAARRANLEAGPRSSASAQNAIMVLSGLGEIDAAFAIADGYFLRKGSSVGSSRAGKADMPVNDLFWRRTMPLFIPVTAALRADPRFLTLCEGMGLTDYWARRAKPDPFLVRFA